MICLRLLTPPQMVLKSASRFANCSGRADAIGAARVTMHPVPSREEAQWMPWSPSSQSQTQFQTYMDSALAEINSCSPSPKPCLIHLPACRTLKPTFVSLLSQGSTMAEMPLSPAFWGVRCLGCRAWPRGGSRPCEQSVLSQSASAG